MLENECSTLEHLRRHFNCSKKTATSLGVYDAENLTRPHLAPTQYSGDKFRSSSSDLEESQMETLDVPYSSDPEEPPTSDPVYHCDDDSDEYVALL